MRFFRKHQRIFPLLILVLLGFSFGIFYNQNKKALAQEPRALQCGEEIPLGEAIDETLNFASAILEQSQTVVTSSLAQVSTARELTDVPDQCQAENCDTDCRLECVEPDPNNGCLRQECIIPPCSGQACPPFEEILTEIQNYYSQINDANEIIKQLIKEDRQPIIDKLNKARKELRNCVTPAQAYLSEEEAKEAEWLISCQEAKYLQILEEGEICYPNNFFCCF
jgi:hypothetical protein